MEANISWWLLVINTIDCSIRVVIVILEYFEHMLTMYAILHFQSWGNLVLQPATVLIVLFSMISGCQLKLHILYIKAVYILKLFCIILYLGVYIL